MRSRSIKRRTMLRGILGASAVSVGLPLLEAMLDSHGEALADGSPLPLRFGVWFWGNGPETFFNPVPALHRRWAACAPHPPRAVAWQLALGLRSLHA